MNDLRFISAEIEIAFDTSVHIGAGRGDVAVNRIVKRTADGQPYVPASALKGALRMAAERILFMTATQDSVAHLLRKGSGLSKNRTVCRAPNARNMCQSKTPCLVCCVFGNGWTGARLLVEDARSSQSDHLFLLKKKTFKYTKEKWAKAVADGKYDRTDLMKDVTMHLDFELERFAATDKEIVTRIQIDRKRRGSAKGHLFTSEYTPAQQVFESNLSGWIPLTEVDEDVPPLELVLLAAAIGFVDQIGGEASTGHGLCRISLKKPGQHKKGKEEEAGRINVDEGLSWTLEELVNYLDYLPFFS